MGFGGFWELRWFCNFLWSQIRDKILDTPNLVKAEKVWKWSLCYSKSQARIQREKWLFDQSCWLELIRAYNSSPISMSSDQARSSQIQSKLDDAILVFVSESWQSPNRSKISRIGFGGFWELWWFCSSLWSQIRDKILYTPNLVRAERVWMWFLRYSKTQARIWREKWLWLTGADQISQLKSNLDELWSSQIQSNPVRVEWCGFGFRFWELTKSEQIRNFADRIR